MTPTRTTAALLAVAVAALAAPAEAQPRPGRTERVSVATDGTEGDAGSSVAIISDDGRFAFFVSAASNLVPGDANGTWDIFVRDRVEGTTELVTVNSAGEQANGYGIEPHASPDGRYVVFVSPARNLEPVPGFTGSSVFLRDRAMGTTERVTLAHDGQPGSGAGARVSADGRYVVFGSGNTHLVPGDSNSTFDVFLRNRVASTTELVSVASDGTQGNGESFYSDVSHDGKAVAFSSIASNLVEGVTNGVFDIFVRDRAGEETTRVSVASDGAQANGSSSTAAISGDGRHVAFTSVASNLVPADANVAGDVFVHDRTTGRTSRVSVSSDGAEGDGDSFRPFVSADGRYVTFLSSATNLVPDDTNGQVDAYVHDRVTGTTERLSVASGGSQATPATSSLSTPTVSADGRHAAFVNAADNLAPGVTNGTHDVYARDRGPDLGVGALDARAEDERLTVSGWATFSGALLAASADRDDDGGPVGPLSARDLGGELLGASVAWRPEIGDVLVRWDLAHLPGVRAPAAGAEVGYAGSRAVPSLAGAPGVTYGLRFTVDGVDYRAAGGRAGASLFSLYRCVARCEPVALLDGSVGVAGVEARMSLPLAALGAGAPLILEDVEAFTEVGAPDGAQAQRLDEVALGSTGVPAAAVLVAAAADGATPGDSDWQPVALDGGVFAAVLERPPGSELRVWARACLGADCRSVSAPVR